MSITNPPDCITGLTRYGESFEAMDALGQATAEPVFLWGCQKCGGWHSGRGALVNGYYLESLHERQFQDFIP